MAKWNFSYKAPKVTEDTPVKLTVNTLYNGTVKNTNYATINIIRSSSLKSLFTFIIDEDVALTDSAGCISLANDAVGTTGDEIQEWAATKPLILAEGGVEFGDLNPNDLSKFTTGSSAPITTVGYDTMVKFPKRLYNMSKTGNKVTIQITGDTSAVDKGFVQYPWIDRTGQVKDAFYMGAYECYVSNSKMYSVSGVAPSDSIQWQYFKQYAENRGTGYRMRGWYQMLYYQILYIAIIRNLNSQNAVGRGNCYSSSKSSTGLLNAKGPTWGDQTSTSSVKFLNIENPWGSLYECVDDIYMNKSGNIYTNRGTGYVNTFNTSHTGDGYFSNIIGGNDSGFYPSNVSGGSESKTYGDYHWNLRSYDQTIVLSSGGWADGSYVGAFYLRVCYPVPISRADFGGRLLYV